MQPLSKEELQRYTRHFSVTDIGIKGQERLKTSRVLLIGAGGIGSPASLYLAAQGIGTLGIIDHDNVELSNLQRQILFTDQDLGKSKALVAKQKLQAQNPHCNINAYDERLTHQNAPPIFEHYDLIIDGSDNYPTRYLVADVAWRLEKPMISASIYQFSGQLMLVDPKAGPCYRCLYPSAPPEGLIPNCAAAGVLGVIPGVLATLAVTEAIKHLLDIGKPLSGQLLQFDAKTMTMEQLPLHARADCHICGQAAISMTDILSSHQPQKSNAMKVNAIDVITLQKKLNTLKPPLLIDVREPWERELCVINPSLHIPLSQLDTADIPANKDDTILIYCRSGGRSALACQVLMQRGFHQATNVSGGTLAWASNIDPTMIRY